MLKSFQPTKGRLLLRPQTQDEKTAGGLYIPDTVETELQRAEVVAVGTLTEDIQVGNKVVYEHGMPLEIEGEKFVMVHEEQVLAVVP